MKPLIKNFSFTLIVVLLASMLQACSENNSETSSPANHNISIEFKAIDVNPEPSEEQNHASEVLINGQKQSLDFNTLFKTGDENNGETFGLIKDIKGLPIKFADNSDYICNGTNDGVGSGLDHISILQKNGKLFMVSQYECVLGAMYLNELQQSSDGQLTVKPNSLKYIDQSSDYGGFVHCAGMTTPWQSHLASEEYEPDARKVETLFDPDTGLTGMSYYDELRLYWQDELNHASPYFYGWIPEVQIDQENNPVYQKHYSMGRVSHELAYVMPDKKTVYMSDDGSNGGLYMFIADKIEDLSSGHLYAAKWVQTSDQGLGKAILNWADLGHTSDAFIKNWVAKKLKFSNIFDTAERDDKQQCPTGYRSVNTMTGAECLKLKDINLDGQISLTDEVIASRLETRRMAAYVGATTEFRKSEGITYNPDDNELYLAISEVSRGMENFKKNAKDNPRYDLGGANDISLKHNQCGGVYKLELNADRSMKSDYVAKQMSGLLSGQPVDDDLNSCSLDGIANPDNLTYLTGSHNLVIGEDTDHHQNNLVWSYDLKTKKLVPIFSSPTDAETTSPFWHKDINGFGYLTVVTQHPLKSEDVEEAKKQSRAGVFGPFKWEQ